jgi:hypothetical protein
MKLPLAVWPPPGADQTASPYSRVVWPPEVSGQTASLCIVCGLTATEAGQTARSSNGWSFELKVVVTTLTVWSPIALRSDREVRKIFPAASFWSVDYKYSSILCKVALLAISTAYLTLESPLPSHTSIPW